MMLMVLAMVPVPALVPVEMVMTMTTIEWPKQPTNSNNNKKFYKLNKHKIWISTQFKHDDANNMYNLLIK